jgi:hypothetical protein
VKRPRSITVYLNKFIPSNVKCVDNISSAHLPAALCHLHLGFSVFARSEIQPYRLGCCAKSGQSLAGETQYGI